MIDIDIEDRSIVGVVPAAGVARRLSPLPCSKELFPIGFTEGDGAGERHPKAVCHYLLENLREAGITTAFVILRKSKWDIPSYLGDGRMVGMRLAYLTVDQSPSVPYTVDQAYPFVRRAWVAFGFPDVIVRPRNVFVQLLERQSSSNADIVLGLFHVDNPRKFDMVEHDASGRVQRIVIKPETSRLKYAWCVAVWGPRFTRFLHQIVAECRAQGDITDRTVGDASGEGELYIGEVVQNAILQRFEVQGVFFPHGHCLDIGTPEDLARAIRRMDDEARK